MRLHIGCCKLQLRQRVRFRRTKNAYAKGRALCTPPISGSRPGGWLRLVAQLAAARAAATALFLPPAFRSAKRGAFFRRKKRKARRGPFFRSAEKAGGALPG